MTSRALPDDFDFSQSLKQAHGKRYASPLPDVSFKSSEVGDDSGKPTLTPRDNYGVVPCSEVTVSTLSQTPSGKAVNSSLNLWPGELIKDGLRYPRSSYSGLASSLTMTPNFIDPYADLGNILADSHEYGDLQIPKEHSPERLRDDLLVSPLAHLDPQFMGVSPDWVPSSLDVSLPPFPDEVVSPANPSLASSGLFFSVQHPSQLFPAAGSAEYTFCPSYYPRDVETNTWQSRQFGRFELDGRTMRHSDLELTSQAAMGSSIYSDAEVGMIYQSLQG